MKQSRLRKLLLIAPAAMMTAVGVGSVNLETAVGQTNSQPAKMAVQGQSQEKNTLRFDFNKTKWEVVIKWFAEQGGLTVYPPHGYPSGTYTNIDGTKYSVAEALDTLNHRLQLNGFLLVRYKTQLIVLDASKGFESRLIENIKAEDLDKRGKYELLKCVFDVTNLPADEIRTQLEQLVDEERGKVVAIGAANKIMVREFGGVLREIRDLIEAAKKQKERASKKVKMQHVTYDTVMRIARPYFGMASGEDQLSDGSLVIGPGNSDKILWVSGTNEKVQRLLKLVTTMDTKENSIAEEEVLPMVYQTFPIGGDSDVIQEIITDRFSGDPGIQAMRYSAESKLLVVKATDKVIKEIRGMIENVQSKGEVSVRISTNLFDAEDLIETLQTSLGYETDLTSTTGSSEGNVPRFIPQNDSTFIVMGPPADVKKIQNLAEMLDPAPKETDQENRDYEIIRVDDAQMNNVIDGLETIWKARGKGKLLVRMPGDRRDPLSGGRSGSTNFRNPAYDREFGKGEFQKRLGSPNEMTDQQMLDMIEKIRKQLDDSHRMKKQMMEEEKAKGKKSGREITSSDFNRLPLRSTLNNRVYASAKQDPQEKDDQQKIQLKGLGPDDVILQKTEGGFLVLSNNPAAIREVRRIIASLTIGSSVKEPASIKPITFFLQFKKAEDLKGELEDILQLSDNSGGGGGALGNMVQKAIPIPGLGNMMGGGGSSVASSSEKTVGDVFIHADGMLNALHIFAEPEDIEMIEYLISLKDRAAPPHNPTVTGEPRIIPVKNRDVEELKTILGEQFKEYVQSANPAAAAAAGGRGNPMQQMMKTLQGKNKKKTVSKPQIVISADPTGSAIIVTGPSHITAQVETMVKKLDSEDLLPERSVAIVSLPPGVSAETLQALFPDSFETGGSSGAGKSKAQPGQGGAKRPTGMPNLGNLRNMFGGGNRAFGGGNRGGSTRGGGNRGGSTRGGGNRGGGNRGGGRGGRGR